MTIELRSGDCRYVLPTLPVDSVQCVVTSPPYYGLRDYGCAGQIGLEPTPDEYLATMVAVFREVRRVLRPDGTCWVNMGDSYNTYPGNRGSSKSLSAATNGAIPSAPKGYGLTTTTLANKQLLMMPARLALALQADGWWIRSDIIWHKPNPMPESCRDRPTSAHEHVFLITKSSRYYYDADAVRSLLADKTFTTFGTKHRPQGNDAGGNVKSDNWGSSLDERKPKLNGAGEIAGAACRNVWTIATAPYSEAHFATFPPALAERCIKAGSRLGDTVLDPFAGAGTTLLVADRLQRDAIGIELNTAYTEMAMERCRDDAPLFVDAPAADPEDARMADLFGDMVA